MNTNGEETTTCIEDLNLLMYASAQQPKAESCRQMRKALLPTGSWSRILTESHHSSPPSHCVELGFVMPQWFRSYTVPKL